MLGEDTLMADMLGEDTLGADTLLAHTMMADTLGEDMLGCGCWRWLCGKSLFFTPNVHLFGFLLIVCHGLGHPSLYVLYTAAVARVVAEYCV